MIKLRSLVIYKRMVIISDMIKAGRDRLMNKLFLRRDHEVGADCAGYGNKTTNQNTVNETR